MSTHCTVTAMLDQANGRFADYMPCFMWPDDTREANRSILKGIGGHYSKVWFKYQPLPGVLPVFGTEPKGNFPYLALQREGQKPFVVRRDAFERLLELVEEYEVRWEVVQEPTKSSSMQYDDPAMERLDWPSSKPRTCHEEVRYGDAVNKLVISYRRGTTHGTAKFYNALANGSWPLKQRTDEWLRLERRKHGRCDCWDFRRLGSCSHVEMQAARAEGKTLTPRQRKIAALERELAGIQLHAPSYPWKLSERLCQNCEERDYWHTRSDFRNHCGNYTPGPACVNRERNHWLAWHKQREVRRGIMQRMRAWRAARSMNSTANLYKIVNELLLQVYAGSSSGIVGLEGVLTHRVTVKPWSKLNTAERRRMEDDFGIYLSRLWESCGLISKPYADRGDLIWSRERYVDWLEQLHQRNELAGMIAALKAEEGALPLPMAVENAQSAC